MDLKDTNTKKCTQGLRRPFGVAGKGTHTAPPVPGACVRGECTSQTFSFALLLALPCSKTYARQPLILKFLEIKSK